jgi:hypothetical protein
MIRALTIPFGIMCAGVSVLVVYLLAGTLILANTASSMKRKSDP